MDHSLEIFRANFMEELRNDASCYEDSVGDRFLNYAFEQFQESGIIQDPQLCYFEKKGRHNRMMQVHGYAFDEADSSLSLIISAFNDTNNIETITQTQINSYAQRLLAFLDEVCNGDLSQYCDESDALWPIAEEIKFRFGVSNSIDNVEILKVKLVIVTNSVLSNQVKQLSADDFRGKPVEINIWSLERFYELKNTANSEPVNIDVNDFKSIGIPCVKADLGQDEDQDYEAYLGVISGRLLAEIYCKFGSQLLEGNIRSFLSAKGRINNGIRCTIKDEPKRFFTYNNGIATTAKDVTITEKKGGHYITQIFDFQIINGGQTTASLASALLKKDGENLDKIFVPMKMTIVRPIVANNDNAGDDDDFNDRYQDMIAKISRFANSQNPVKEADFFSNHEFHRLMERKSKRIFAPPLPGTIVQTRWFYERSRGKWEQEQMGMTEAKKNAFLRQNPKKQRVTKERFAKCYFAYLMHPEIVSRGAEKNMKEFRKYITDLWDKKRNTINDFFFKEGIVSIIIYDTADQVINKQQWYPKGGCKAELVPYTIAKIISLIPSNKWLNLEKIWNDQRLSPAFIKAIEQVSHEVFEYLTKRAHGGLVRTIAQKEDTWNEFKSQNIALPQEFLDELIDKSHITDLQHESENNQKTDTQVSLEVQVFKLGATFWKTLLEHGCKANLLTPKEIDILNIGCTFDTPRPKLPSPAQAKIMMKAKERLENEGIHVTTY